MRRRKHSFTTDLLGEDKMTEYCDDDVIQTILAHEPYDGQPVYEYLTEIEEFMEKAFPEISEEQFMRCFGMAWHGHPSSPST